MAKSRKPEDDARNQEESARILERVAQESETVGTSSMHRIAGRVTSHISGDADPDNPVEVWGTRIGRTLGLVFFIGLAIYMIKTYILHV